jgi:hypothetical protein
MAWKIFKKSKYFGGFFLKFFKIHKYRQSPSKKKTGPRKKLRTTTTTLGRKTLEIETEPVRRALKNKKGEPELLQSR